jgi:iron complex transport system substrate-binding protein
MSPGEVYLKFSFMSLKYYICGLCLLFAGLQACRPGGRERSAMSDSSSGEGAPRYAKRFAISEKGGETRVYVFGNRRNYDTTATFVLYRDSLPSGLSGQHVYPVRVPCRKVAALSSIYAAMLCELGEIARLAAIDNIDYVNDERIIRKHRKGDLAELARGPQISLEPTIALDPDIIFTFGMGEGEKDRDKKLDQSGIPVAISIDHLEESPLARAEWIKFIAVFVDRQATADSIFDLVERNYLRLKSLAIQSDRRPSVFTEIKYSDFWYMPGGKSYVAKLLHDASANYLWKDDQQTGSLPLSFEQVYVRAGTADFWLNLSTVKTREELLSYDSRYTEFKAFRMGRLYNNTRFTNSKGYSNYWETGMIYPDRILSDLIRIFHPELNTGVGKDWYYYEQIH